MLEPEYGIIAIGSGGSYASAAARALLQHTEMAPKDIVKRSLEIAGRPVHLHEPEPLDRDARMTNPSSPVKSAMTPQEIVSELDRHIVGQGGAKRAVAIALRNRWRRQQVEEAMRGEITPKNILMIGPTGVGKTEIARRLARLADAPFIKVEATKFTEVGYVGKDVDSIVRDLVDMAVKQERETAMRRQRARAEDAAEERILEIIVPGTRAEFGLAPFALGRQHRPPGDAKAPARRRARRQGDRDRGGRGQAVDGDHGPAGHGGDDRAAARHVRQPRRRRARRRAR